ncbi:hypothetical protein AAMO2058_000218400 [Amorphochlora amoebiformis]|uniref:Transcription initiation factor TFIID subunit 10 n=1 Tax=Amorphochlora amoebiformis TaxID=1561963 RepID=A0A7S0GMA7_9EUKA|mmetsp:Transcript_10445/g.16494  ORF Transcript_10445/g.16494 Transcript_10445/m.16494 type:complete len:128 (+) Transcript_10445:28-411(+)
MESSRPKRPRPAERSNRENFLSLLKKMDDYEPTIPDAVVEHYLEKVGFAAEDRKITRLVALATQKFLYEIITDAMQHSKIREKKDAKKRKILQMEDLALSLKQHGINVVKPDFLVDSLSTLHNLNNN